MPKQATARKAEPRVISAPSRSRARPNDLAREGEAAAVWVDPRTLIRNPKNPRRNDAAVAPVARAIEQDGFGAPIVARLSNRMIIAGDTRWRAAVEELDLPLVPVRFLDVTQQQFNRMTVGDNRLGEFAEWDDRKLVELLQEMEPTDQLLAGYGPDDIGELLAEMERESGQEVVEDEVPEPPKVPVTKLGDVWLLGRHRLVCGDCTNDAVVRPCMDGQRASCVFTDPPYGMQYKGRTFGKEGLANDDANWVETLRLAGLQIREAAVDAVIAVCFAPSRLDQFFGVLTGLTFHRLLTIYKPNGMAYPWQGWILTSEHIALFSTGKPTWNDAKHCHDVYTFDYSERPDRSVDHPTVKPVSIVADVLSKTSAPAGLVLDPFLGSGTTLIAAERLNRRCFGIELSPAYCDVIVERWQNLTGEKAKRA